MNVPGFSKAAALLLTAVAAPAFAQGRELPAESAMVAAILTAGRGADPVVCDLAARTVEARIGGWGIRWISQGPRAAGVRSVLPAVSRDHVETAALPLLRAALLGDDACVRRLAVPLLGRVRHASALQAVRQLLQDERAEVRQAAAWAAGFSENAEQIPALLGALQDQRSEVRIAAAWALGEIEDRRAVGALARVLREDRDPAVRAAAAYALGNIEG